MPRINEPNALAVYEAAAKCIEAGLEQDDSVFTPGRPIWTEAAADEFYECFVDNPDESSDTFDVKLGKQLAAASPGAIQLAAELLYLHFLIALNVKGDTKRGLINKVLGWGPDQVSIPGDLDAALDVGIASTGMAFLTYRNRQIEFLLEFVRALKGLDSEERERVLADPWEFKALVSKTAVKASQAQQDSLLHLAFPDSFEPIVSRRAKKRIAEHYADRVTAPTSDVDKQLDQIRDSLTEEFGKDFGFYDPEIVTQWQRDPSKWSRFIQWAERFYGAPNFESQERDYKIKVIEKIGAARDAVISKDDEWYPVFKRAFGSPNNMTNHHSHSRLFEWCEEEPEDARQALERLFTDGSPTEERVRHFSDAFPTDYLSGRGVRLNLISFLLMGTDPVEYPVYMFTPFKDGFDLVDYPKPAKSAGEAGVYKHAIQFLDDFASEAESRGLQLRDRLDAQGVLWALTQWNVDDLDFMTPEERRAFRKYRGEEEEERAEEKDPEVHDGDGDDYGVDSLDALAAAVYMDKESLRVITELLESKGQVIFFGPPGTGKTFVAMRLAEYLTRDGGSIGKVQFHPSYAYEDFVEGYRPALLDNGQPGFTRQAGPLLRAAHRASAEPEATHVLIIDEINRGNIAKIFGELYFLLEYRNEEIQLQYSDARFQLPDNLKIIGTMNTADRSIALVDLALRRRFHFFPFFPDEAPVEGLLHRWLAANNDDLRWVADLVDLVNEKLPDRDMALGPSHFMEKSLTEASLDRIWRFSVLPYLAEQFYGETERLHEFDLTRLRKELAGEVVALDKTEADDGSHAEESSDDSSAPE